MAIEECKDCPLLADSDDCLVISAGSDLTPIPGPGCPWKTIAYQEKRILARGQKIIAMNAKIAALKKANKEMKSDIKILFKRLTEALAEGIEECK